MLSGVLCAIVDGEFPTVIGVENRSFDTQHRWSHLPWFPSPDRDLVLWENMVLGSIAGGCAAAVTTPLDVAKTRLMTQTLTAKAERYTGIRHALQHVYAEGGVAGLFAGIKPRVLWISVGGAIFIGSFEEYKRLMSRR